MSGVRMSKNIVSIETAIMWIISYLVICGIVPAILNRLIFRYANKELAAWLNLSTLVILNYVFICKLKDKYQLKIQIFSNLSLKGILLAVGCSILFYLLLDKFFDPIFDGIFSSSAEAYKNNIGQLRQFPFVNFIRICLIAPLAEEILIRGFILEGLKKNYSVFTALLISSLLFAVLHFNFVQTLSALICGLILGLLYINTKSLFSCILAHFLYNTISYLVIFWNKKS